MMKIAAGFNRSYLCTHYACIKDGALSENPEKCCTAAIVSVMVRQAIIGFIALALFFYLISYPGHAVSVLQMIVDGAHNLADAIKNLRLK